MTQTSRLKLTVLSLVAVSLVGMILTPTLLFYTSTAQDLPWRRSIISSIYALICILGVIAVFFPKNCSRIVRSQRWETTPKMLDNHSQPDERKTTFLFWIKLTHGHHPDCESFFDHELHIGKRTFCAGCAGLLIGALISLTVVPAYFLSQVQLDKAATPLVGFGFIAVSVGLLTPIFIAGRGFIKLITNAFFILGMSSILVGTDTLLHSLQIDMYLIALDVFWLMTRISISKLNHERICANCTQECVQ